MSHSASQSTTEPAVAVAAQPPSAAASSIATATELKAAGNELFAKGENDKAIAKWSAHEPHTRSHSAECTGRVEWLLCERQSFALC